METPIVYVSATISGPTEFLQKIVATGFDLNVLHPIPAGVNRDVWRYVHWGTQEALRNVVVEYTPESGILTVSFETGGRMPFSIFLYIADKYPELEMDVLYEMSNGGATGRLVNDGTSCVVHQVDPIYHTDSSIRRFGETSSWFNAEDTIAKLAGVQSLFPRSDADMLCEESLMTYPIYMEHMEYAARSIFGAPVE